MSQENIVITPSDEIENQQLGTEYDLDDTSE